ncbi:divergent PAP2 family protein [Eremococcus coleocola]|uniref:Divergent PAP2 family n=1 Tax=Eremococcus coleocola ACS-139-V-Col8 TaxID=908337 RepID=E4KNE1_9LACT|nr:divergent PAP2 family protein [Eremococcus coleocola]EFR31515.1 divergent PAP2 family [Eremococcus coleocola ACS-139-V-Col8]
MNMVLLTSLAAILLAQLIKYPIAAIFNKRAAKINIITSTGGMPSSHSAAVSSLISALIFEYGFASPYVAIATVFGVIIMFDSMGVRRQSGEQGVVLDILARHHQHILEKEEKPRKETSVNPIDLTNSLINYDQMVIKRYMGHTPSEVIAGIIFGALVAVLFRSFL